MKRELFKFYLVNTLLAVVFFFCTVSPSNGQTIKTAATGYAPVNCITMYYEVYGEGMPIVLLHGAFCTIDMNWAVFIPELAKSGKVIAVELQGHGHTPFSNRKLARTTLASDVEKLLDFRNQQYIVESWVLTNIF